MGDISAQTVILLAVQATCSGEFLLFSLQNAASEPVVKKQGEYAKDTEKTGAGRAVGKRH
jgi:hypothetical protein